MNGTSGKTVLMVLTSHDQLGDTGEKTGFWIEEFAAPYYTFVDAGFEVELASPKGGQPPVDPKSELEDFQTSFTQRYDQDQALQQKLANTRVLSEVDGTRYDGVFYPGGHGPLWDLASDSHSINLISSYWQQNKPVAVVCHASAALLEVKDGEGKFMVAGRQITGFSNTEEAAVALVDVVPFLLEDELINRGADYQKSQDWADFSITDGHIISGQNPASSASTAKKLIEMLSLDSH